MKKKALCAAFPHTLPVLMGYLFLGIAFGVLLSETPGHHLPAGIVGSETSISSPFPVYHAAAGNSSPSHLFLYCLFLCRFFLPFPAAGAKQLWNKQP